MPLPVYDPSRHREPRMEKIRLKMEMAAAEMLYSGRGGEEEDDFANRLTG